MTKEQQIKIQRCIDEFYSNRPQVRDELGAALQVLYEAQPKVAMRYKPVCKYGKYHCVNDPAYIQYAHPKWYEELSKGKTPEELMKSKWCRYCKNGSEYDDEDK